MGDMSDDLQHPEPAFRRIGVDIAGPYLMKADVKRRSVRRDDCKVKIWVAVFVWTTVKKDFCKHGDSTM